MYQFTKFYINGSWVAPSGAEKLAVVNPANEEVVGEISLGTEQDLDLAVQAATKAFDSFSQSTRQQRVELLESIIQVYKKHYDKLAVAISDEMGSPITKAQKSQAACGVGHLATARKALLDFQFEQALGSTQLVKDPIGVCGFITPWNWPINQIACKVAPALATGCTMVLKPSEVAPLSAYIFAEILHEAGVPPGVFNLVNGDGPTVGTALATHPLVDMVSFTGSTKAGILVAKAAADTVKRVTQELGGKSANILLPDADLDKMVTQGVLNCFGNTGQSCNAPTRLLVPTEKHDQAVAIAIKAIGKICIGDTKDPATTMGPLANKKQFDKVQGLIQQAIDEGCELAYGGPGKPEGMDKGYYVKPTLFSHVSNDMTIAREEVFGPVLAVMPYENEDQAITIANDSPYGLSGYVSSSDLQRARKVAARLRAGMVHINGAEEDFEAPFGGYKQSGNGREWGAHGFNDFLEIKSVVGYR